MHKLWPLLKLELYALYGINKHRFTKDKKARGRYKGLCVVWAFLFATVCAYVTGLVFALCSLGLQTAVSAFLVFIASMLILFFGLFTASHRIFGQKGCQMLSAMPVTKGAVVLSRFLSLYTEDLALTLLVMLPGTLTYGILEKPGIVFYLTALTGTLFIPLMPLMASVLFGTAIAAVSARMKRKSLVQSILTVIFVAAVMFLPIGVGNPDVSLEAISGAMQEAYGLLCRFCPPVSWLSTALAEGKLLYLVLFILASVAVGAVGLWLCTLCFQPVMEGLSQSTAGHSYKLTRLQRGSILKALYIREAKRYFSSSIYVTNTIVGPVLAAVMAVSLYFAGTEMLAPLNVYFDTAALLPYFFAGVFCMMTTTSTAISMEGKQVWIVKSLPISTKALLDSKILLNLSLMLPFYLLGEVFLVLAVKPTPLALIQMLVIPALITVLSVVLGITVNLKFHSFSWEKEEQVVKQSVSSALGGFAGLFPSLIFGGLQIPVPEAYRSLYSFFVCLLLIAGTVFFYRKNNKTVLAQL